jgi:hypothetical protein
VEVEVRIQGVAEAVKEGDGSELGRGRGAGRVLAEQGADRPQEDAEHRSGEGGIPG